MHELASALAALNPKLNVQRLADSLFAFISNESPYLRLIEECRWSQDDYARVTRAILAGLIRDATG